MSLSMYLSVSKTFEGGRRQQDDFELPEKTQFFRSTRFGKHALSENGEFLKILPVTENENNASVPKRRSNVSSAQNVIAISRKFHKNGDVPEKAGWRTWPGRLIGGILNCKAQAASFFW